MKSKILFTLFIISSTLILNSCLKKGEDDPAVSLHSRKARMAGDWKVTSYIYKDTQVDSSGSTTKYDFSGNESTYTVRLGFPNPYYTGNGTFRMKWMFTKDGKYTSNISMDAYDYKSDGLWNFTGGVGEFKDKSQVVLLEQNYSSKTGLFTHTGNFISEVYDIMELKNKEMHWHSKIKNTYPTGKIRSEEVEYEIIFVLQKK